MKRETPLSDLIFGFIWIGLYLQHPNYIVLAGIGLFSLITSIFEIKNYHNNKLYLAITGAILAVFLTLAYFQISSPQYTGILLVNFFSITLFIFLIIIGTYDFTHDYKLSKLQIKNQRPLIKYGIPVIIIITAFCVGIWFATFIFT